MHYIKALARWILFGWRKPWSYQSHTDLGICNGSHVYSVVYTRGKKSKVKEFRFPTTNRRPDPHSSEKLVIFFKQQAKFQ